MQNLYYLTENQIFFFYFSSTLILCEIIYLIYILLIKRLLKVILFIIKFIITKLEPEIISNSIYVTEKQKLAIDLCNSLIEEEFSAQDIMDIAEEFYGFARAFYWEQHNEKNSYPKYLNRNPFFTTRHIYDFINYMYISADQSSDRLKENKEIIENIIEDLRKEIKLIAKAILEAAKKDNLEYRKELKEKGYSKEKIKKEADLDKVDPLPSIKISQYVYYSKMGYPRIGENKLKMILDGRIIRAKMSRTEAEKFLQSIHEKTISNLRQILVNEWHEMRQILTGRHKKKIKVRKRLVFFFIFALFVASKSTGL